MSLARDYGFPFSLAVLVHVAFIAIFLLSLEFTPKPPAPLQPEVDVIQATAVDEQKVLAELDKLKKAEQRKRQEEDARQQVLESEARKAKAKREVEEQRVADLAKKREQEKQHLVEMEKKKKVESERLAKEQSAEQERIKKIQKEREELQRRMNEEQSELAKRELQRKLDDETAKEKQRAEQQRKQKAELDKRAQSEVAKLVQEIKSKVQSVWIEPSNYVSGSSCTVSVRLLPTGEVMDAKLSACKGDDIFRRSVEAAVVKASPLPVSKDPEVFDRMREINFVFNPK